MIKKLQQKKDNMTVVKRRSTLLIYWTVCFWKKNVLWKKEKETFLISLFPRSGAPFQRSFQQIINFVWMQCVPYLFISAYMQYNLQLLKNCWLTTQKWSPWTLSLSWKVLFDWENHRPQKRKSGFEEWGEEKYVHRAPRHFYINTSSRLSIKEHTIFILNFLDVVSIKLFLP